MSEIPLKVKSTKKKGDITIKSYNVTKLKNLGFSRTLEKMSTLLTMVDAPIAMIDEGTALGYFNGVSKFRVAFRGTKMVAVHMKGETEDGETFNKKFGERVFGRSGGLRLDVQSRRTQRNRGSRKSRKLRKLTTRRR